jgi:hypothetical protein
LSLDTNGGRSWNAAQYAERQQCGHHVQFVDCEHVCSPCPYLDVLDFRHSVSLTKAAPAVICAPIVPPTIPPGFRASDPTKAENFETGVNNSGLNIDSQGNVWIINRFGTGIHALAHLAEMGIRFRLKGLVAASDYLTRTIACSMWRAL